MRQRGGDPTLGRKLYTLSQAGIPSPNVQLLQQARTGGEAKWLSLLTLDTTALAIVAEGIASESDIATARSSLIDATKDPQTVLGGPNVPGLVTTPGVAEKVGDLEECRLSQRRRRRESRPSP